MTTPEPISERRAVAMAFLQRVLPASGVYFAAVKPRSGKGVKRQACANFVELWNVLSDESTDTYFSTASFKDNTSSAGANIEAIQALRLDIDCGPKRPYTTPDSGMVATLNFAKALSLPPPGFVKSGSGVHAWWPLATPLSRTAWERYAEGLKAACKTHGLAADPVVTTDAARILRCPGTFNCKQAPVEVELHSYFFKCGPFALELFNVLVESNVVNMVASVPSSEREETSQPASQAVYCPATVRYYASMLAAIPLEDREDRSIWFETGAALHELGWGEAGFKLWCLWSQKSAKYDETDQAKTWASFARPYTGAKITAGSLCQRARQHGWAPALEPPASLEPASDMASPEAPAGPFDQQEADQPVSLSAERLKKDRSWQLSAAGKIKDHNYQNCRIALATMEVRARHNVFIGKKDALVPWLSPEWVTFSDDLIAPLRKRVLDIYKFDPGKDCVVDVLEEFAIDGAYDPVVNYLKALEWDGRKRLETWLTTYLGAEDNDLNRCFGTTTLVAAVRRAFYPGTKFDHMLILEGEQGTGKSTTVEILGLKEYYKNQAINFQDPRSVVEALNGAWFYEWAELAGMRRTETERLKAMLSTAVDSCRMAYGRMVTIRPRRCILIATTNAVQSPYLSDLTGGRRYWPVVTKQIHLDELRQDIDQLYAEAVAMEPSFGPLTIPNNLIAQVLVLQKSRTQLPTWFELLSEVRGQVVNKGTPWAEERVTITDVLTQWLKVTAAQMHIGTYKLIADSMRELGWVSNQFRRDGKIYNGYVRKINTVQGEDDGPDFSA